MGVVNLEEIATASPRMQGMSFGPADLAASRRMKTTRVGGGHPGYRVIEDPDPDDPDAPRATAQQDPWHYSIARMVDACTSAGILPFYGPFGDIKDVEGCEAQFRAAFLLGCVGAWSLHPVQIDIAKKVFSPDPDEVALRQEGDRGDPRRPRRPHDRRQDAGRRHLEAVQGDGRPRRACSPRRTPSWPRPTGSRPRRRVGSAPPCASTSTSRADRRARPASRSPSTASPRPPTRRAAIAADIGGPTVIKSQVLTGGRMKAGGVQVRRHARRGGRARRGHPRSSRSTATCRAACWSTRRPQVKQEYYAGVVWDGTAQAAADAVQRHGRDRHRAGRRGAPRPRRPRPLLEPAPLLRLPGQAGDRRRRRRPARS